MLGSEPDLFGSERDPSGSSCEHENEPSGSIEDYEGLD
jgi:hypothetical protein